MSEVRERPRTRRPARRRATRGAALARWRVASRLARRQVARTRLSSLLVVVLVALPIAAMSGFAVWADSSVGTPAERARVELGEMEGRIQAGGVPGAGLWQVPDDPAWTGYPTDGTGGWTTPVGELPADPAAALPAGTETVEIVEGGSIRVDTAAGSAPIPAWWGETWHPSFAGRFDPVDGRAPADATEAWVTPATLERVGITLGDPIVLSDTGEAFTVVGTAHAAGVADRDPGVFLPLTDPARSLAAGERHWYVPDDPLPWSEVRDLNAAGVVALSRAVLLDPPTALTEDEQRAASSRQAMFWSMVAVIAVGGAFAAYVVVMLAGAAFAVAARRQQRSLAIAASVGASPRDLFRTVLLQGTSLGAVGGVIGVALGVVLGAAALALVDDGSGTNPWGLHIPWPGLVAILVFAVLVGTLSALVPARGVARSDAITALRGARRPQRPTAARPLWGSLLLVVGAAATIACALLLAALSASGSAVSYDSPLRWLPIWGIVLGPIIAQIGILLSGRWLLWTTSRALSRASTAARIASRDAAANASRTVPAFAAIAATVFLGVFVTAAASMSTAQSARSWYYSAPVGTASISAWPAYTGAGVTPEPLTPAQWSAAIEEGRMLLEDAGASDIAVVERQSAAWAYADAASVPDEAIQAIALMPSRHLLDPAAQDSFSSLGADPQNNLSVVDPDDVETALGTALTASDLAAYRAGAAIVTDSRYTTDSMIDIAAWPLRDAFDGRIPDNIWERGAGSPEIDDPLWQERLDAVVVDTAPQPVSVAIAPDTARELGLVVSPERVIGALAEPLAPEESDRLYQQASLMGGAGYDLSVNVENGPPSSASWLVPLLAVVGVLVVGASSVALGLARFERRPDDATLAAIGGTPGLRRRIGFWQGLLIAGFGTLSGAVAGLLPAIGLSIQAPDTQRLADVPWIVLLGLAIALPLLIAAVNAAIPPRRPDLTRRTAIA